MNRRLVMTAAAIVAAAAPASPAQAEFGPPSILSANAKALGPASTQAVALSADGRYAAIRTASAAVLATAPGPPGEQWRAGILRRDLQTGDLIPVVAGDARDASGASLGGLGDATAPSISATGRFVSFSTYQRLVPADTNVNEDVYVRDMDRPFGDPAAFRLASALGGSDAPISYDDPDRPLAGSQAGPGALSDDGSRVAFIVEVSSDVAGPGTPAWQVVVRDLGTRTTTVVSTTPGGAPAEPYSGRISTQDVRLSADGSTVIWNTFVASQLVAIPDSQDGVGQLLWRRLTAAGAGPVRLVTGEADPDDPSCAPGQELTTAVEPGPCDGPFLSPTGADDSSKIVASAALTRDGGLVAVAAGFDRSVVDRNGAAGTDLYLVDMAAGLSRKQATRRLTRGPDLSAGTGASNVALSADGSWLAYVGKPSIQNPPSPLGVLPAGLDQLPVFAIDLRAQTVQLVSLGFAGDGPDGQSGGASLSDGGERLAFTSEAKNLVFGDSNGQADAFMVSQLHPVPAPVRVQLPAPLAEVSVPAAWRLSATAAARRDGTVLITAVVPGAGSLSVTPRLAPPTVTARGGRARRGRAALRPLAGRAVTTQAAAPGVVRVALKTSKKYRRQLRGKSGLDASITLTFTAAGRPALRRVVTATFKRQRAAAKKGKS